VTKVYLIEYLKEFSKNEEYMVYRLDSLNIVAMGWFIRLAGQSLKKIK